MKSLLLALSLLLSMTGYGFEPSNPDVTLLPPPPPATKLLGIPFGQSPRAAAEAFAELGDPKATPLDKKNVNIARLYRFDGTPPAFAITGGKTQVLFFKNQLIRADILFPPTYANFLLVRQTLFNALGTRFLVSKKTELMDATLRMHLALLKEGEYSKETEQAITDSLLSKETFFYYGVTDSQREFNLVLSYHTIPEEEGEDPSPRLLLHLSLQEPMKEFQEYRLSSQPGTGR